MLAEISTSCLPPVPLPWNDLPMASKELDHGTVLLPSTVWKGDPLYHPCVTGQPHPVSPGEQDRAWAAGSSFHDLRGPGSPAGLQWHKGAELLQLVALIKGSATLIIDRWQLNPQL